ncbi:MAG: 7-carboxy-7-deazaguanine synthase QueE [Chthonomonadaceae bacterium]|nr:7-carboxy-7-deazaguanine synthase QueE [Chthonomonadaceae bacterium]
MSTNQIRLVEIFSSIQGEGVLVGRRQIFVRTYGCNLRCTYCDSPETLKESGIPRQCRVETVPGSWTFEGRESLTSQDDLNAIIRGYLTEPHHSLSITGGEPLLHARFLREWLPDVKAMGLKTFLETNGFLSRHLEGILDSLDYISMDWKAPTATGISPEATLEAHREFLMTATRRGNTEVYVKMVVTPSTSEAELLTAVETIRAVKDSMTLILQPVTPFGTETKGVTPQKMIRFHALASHLLQDVRVIPQTHKMMQLL